MLAAVVPARNEAAGLEKIIGTLCKVPVDLIVPVVNDSQDSSKDIICRLSEPRIKPLFFDQALGLDIPRAIGGKYAFDLGARAVLFVDGDMTGDIRANLSELAQGILLKGVDLALTDCYPDSPATSPLALSLIEIRKNLNLQLGLSYLGAATPSHGPHGMSRKLLQTIDWADLAIPPVALVRASLHQLVIRVETAIPHHQLGSPLRDLLHCLLIADTITGDYREAECLLQGEPRRRCKNGIPYIGYHRFRRFDLLEKFLAESNISE